DSWIKVGLALSNWSNGSELGLSLWDEWSKQASSFVEGDCAKRWASFTPSLTNGVTVSSLYFLAKSLPLNDEGLVARLSSMFSEKMKFCPGVGWLRYRG
ncbi:MAG: PriCT-2 domain-containing protein, partial [Nitrosomonadales bacterium]|nr:PriCT-2 domain-containing protein [Nitrosomonadales bacterium]